MPSLDDLLLKVLDDIYNDKQPTPQDREQLRLALLDLERVRRSVSPWIGVDGNPNVNHIRAAGGSFGIAPLSFTRLYRGSSQSIDHDTETPIQFSYPNSSEFFVIDEAEPTKIKVLYTGHTIGLMGKIQWEANGTGRRGLHVNAYDSAGSLLYGSTMHSLPGSNLASNTLPFSSVLHLIDIPEAAYLKLTVIQTSGGALNLEFVSGGLFILR